MRVIALGTDVSEWNVFTCMLEEGSSFVTKLISGRSYMILFV